MAFNSTSRSIKKQRFALILPAQFFIHIDKKCVGACKLFLDSYTYTYSYKPSNYRSIYFRKKIHKNANF